MRLKNLLLIALISLLASCAAPHKKTKIHSYQTHKAVQVLNQLGEADGLDEVLYWYVWFGPNNSCYSYSSPSPVTSFTGVTWSRTNGLPNELANEKENLEQEQELNEQELSEDMQSELEASPEVEADIDAGSNDSGSDGGDGGIE